MNGALRFCLVTTFYPPYHFGGDAIFVHRLAERSLDAATMSMSCTRSMPIGSRVPSRRQASRKRPGCEGCRWNRACRSPPRSCRINSASRGAYARRIRKILTSNRYDVIHFHNVSLVGGPGVLRYGKAVKLYTAHEYWLICPTHVLFRYNREACVKKTCLACTLHARRPPQAWRATRHLQKCIGSLDRLLLPSRFALERHRADGIDAPMQVLPSFVPVPPDEPAPASGDPYFLFVGRLEKLKGLQDIFPLLRDFPGARLRIAGTGTYEDELRRLAAGMGNVEFLGQVHPSRVKELYRDALAVVVPSLCYEVFPLAPVEAMAHGVPVIARRIGALTEVVEEGGGGIPSTTPEECRAAMARLLASPGLRMEFGTCGRRTALTQWTEDVHVARYLELIRSLMRQRASRNRDPAGEDVRQ